MKRRLAEITKKNGVMQTEAGLLCNPLRCFRSFIGFCDHLYEQVYSYGSFEQSQKPSFVSSRFVPRSMLVYAETINHEDILFLNPEHLATVLARISFGYRVAPLGAVY